MASDLSFFLSPRFLSLCAAWFESRIAVEVQRRRGARR